MSQQGPIIVVSTARRPSFVASLDEAKMFPIIDATWADASRAVAQLQPAAVLVAMPEAADPDFEALAKQIAARQPYLPLIAIDPTTSLPENAIPFSQAEGNFDRLTARLRAALRVRTLHSTVMRRLDDDPATRRPLAEIDLVRDATVLLIGRGAAYPALSVSLGERMGVVGALSIEAAAKHLNTRDIDGIVLGEGFSARVMDAFLTVLAEDPRFRNLPVVLTSDELAPAYDLPTSKSSAGEPAHVAANALPLIRQHALRGASQPYACGRSMPAACSIRKPACSHPRHSTAISQPPFIKRCRVAAGCRWRALRSIPTIRARNSTARGLSAA